MSDAAPQRKARKKVTDYAGIAALITAIGGTVGMLWNQSHYEAKASMFDDSSFNILQYRLGEIEKANGKLQERIRVLELEMARRHGMRARPAPRTPPAPVEGAANSGVASALRPIPQTPQKALAEKVRKKGVAAKDIRQYVEKANRPLLFEDLE